MKPLYILLIGEKTTRLYDVTSTEVKHILSLENLDEKSSLQKILKSNPEKKVRVLIDHSALQFETSPLPKMAIWDRIMHLKHKRDLLGEDIKFKDVRAQNGLLIQSYAKSSQWVENWLRDLSFDSVSFLPIELKNYCEHLDSNLKQSHWMFLSTLEGDYLRQVIYERGHILSARYAKIPNNLNSFEYQEFILKDTKQAIAYLNKKGSNLPLKMHGFSILSFETDDFNLKSITSFDEFLNWWATRKPRLNFQPLNLKTPTASQTRLGLKVAAATVAGLLVMGIAADIYDLYELSQNAKHLEIQKGQLIFTREKLEDELATYDLPLIKSQLAKFSEILNETHIPIHYLQQISQVLEENSDIQILNFQWKNDTKDKVVSLKIHVKAAEDNDRDVITSVFQNFNTALATHFGPAHVTIHKAPFNSSDSGIFSGSTRLDNDAKDLTEKSGLIEVKWSW